MLGRRVEYLECSICGTMINRRGKPFKNGGALIQHESECASSAVREFDETIDLTHRVAPGKMSEEDEDSMWNHYAQEHFI